MVPENHVSIGGSGVASLVSHRSPDRIGSSRPEQSSERSSKAPGAQRGCQ